MPIECLFDKQSDPPAPDDLYRRIEFPNPPQDRPFVFINMVSTVDGKIVLGDPRGSAKGVGGPTDQILFRRLQSNAEAALIGSGTLRASNVVYPPAMTRLVVTRMGALPLDNRFFTDAPDRAFIVAPRGLPETMRDYFNKAARLLECGDGDVDWREAMKTVRQDLGIRVLLCEGGANVNAQLISAGLVDELFLTLAPKIKCGFNLPTIAGGEALPRGVAQALSLVSIYHDGGELYLRYHVDR